MGPGKGEAISLETEVLPHPTEKPAVWVLQLWVTVTGHPTPILAVCDGGAHVALMSQTGFQQLDPKPELCPTTAKIKSCYRQITFPWESAY